MPKRRRWFGVPFGFAQGERKTRTLRLRSGRAENARNSPRLHQIRLGFGVLSRFCEGQIAAAKFCPKRAPSLRESKGTIFVFCVADRVWHRLMRTCVAA